MQHWRPGSPQRCVVGSQPPAFADGRLAPEKHPLPAAAEDGPGGPHWVMVGLVPLFDPPRHDTKETIERCHEVRPCVCGLWVVVRMGVGCGS